ncbi:hypothetical protein ROZALSC1DRAFT_27320 [Rozella allomycis CSF55]|uniref:Uncharacterized protein n=1 Tax=Rozella allomycis (strain CSF55) TaxID=988480 RepID=A0A075ASF9_ROZAC|nr:hypothetical protein O9G_001162 [Rozella allomycis CSF55]RKP21268.1 hypothetical protein ROZALSC1DRAFT_27320 [Rozella allomycis CSF55]|eukprot:EPZ33193.1 hypothetical protein O9G_001162 [Rozella allomycis CSF55]
MKKILVTDPSYIVDKVRYETNILMAPARVNSFEVQEVSSNEIMYSFGPPRPFEDYELLGIHFSDSGMTCIIDDDPKYTEENEIDWEEFALTSLTESSLQYDDEDFPLLKWFGKVPEEDSKLAVKYNITMEQVFGWKENDVVKGMILKSYDLCDENIKNKVFD